MKTVVMVGKTGPAFGDRVSYTEMTYRNPEDIEFEDVWWTRINNWPGNDRADAMRAMFDNAIDTIDR